MKFNEVIESFNKALDDLREFYHIKSKTHFSCYTVHSTSAVGNIREVQSCISYIGKMDMPTKIAEAYNKEVATEEQLQKLINKTEAEAIKELVIYWSNNLNNILNDNIK